MSNQPNEAAQRYSPCREKSETLVGGVVTTMKPNDQGNWVRYSLLRKAEAEIASLRSALANAEKALLVIGERAVCDFDDATVGDVDRVVTDHMKYKDWLRSVMTAATERDALRSALANAEKDRAASARDWEAALSAHDRRVEELNQALAKLAEAEKRADSLQLETNCARNERDSAIDDWGALKSAFLTPPSDRGADTQASGRAVPRETIERLGLQRYYDAPSDHGAEDEP